MKISCRPLMVLVSVMFTSAQAALPTDLLEAGFQHPPDSAKPHTWWHWMNGNITREGITADLEAMDAVGVGGAQIFNVDCGIPQGRVRFMSPEWRALFKHAVREADRLGIELCVHNCAGWSSSGGPWITPEYAMQKVVSRELPVTGPRRFSETLPAPETNLGFYRDIALLAWPQSGLQTDRDPVARDQIVDLTDQLGADGHLDWDAPRGDWILLRVGYTPTGKENHPAPPEGTGLECDKLSREALDLHWAGFMQKILDDAGPLAGKSLKDALIDSYEVGEQTWTPRFRQEFSKRRGYDLLRFLPAMAGHIVDNQKITDRFLWDMRRTIADLFADNYYGHFAELCREHGLLTSIEPYSGPFESLQCGAPADIVMGEFWSGSRGHPSVKLAASAAHIYGKTLVGAESFTATPERGRWQNTPESLKALGDLMYCQGLNRYIFHRYALQPWTNRWPGMTMGQWGFHFERTTTWWEQSKSWLEYVARCQFLLQQGRPVADVAYFCGESVPAELRSGNPPLPPGFDWDGINADVLLHRATVKQGRLVLPDGLSYAALVLPPDDRNLTPPLLKRIHGFVRAGATIVGPPPQRSPSLEGFPQCDTEVRELAAGLWGNCDGDRVTENGVGAGRVVWGRTLVDVLADRGLKPDFEFPGFKSSTRLAYIHRVADEADIYFVSNQRARSEAVDCVFRIAGRTPELWHPESGIIERAPIWRERDGRTAVRLSFDPVGSVFVVFRSQARGNHLVDVELATPPRAETHPQPEHLRILKAVYGAFSDESPGWVDVTDIVRSLIAGGTRRIPASNDMAGDDPAPNTVKQLRIEYRLDGRAETAEVAEGKTLELPAHAEVTKALYGRFDAQPGARSRSVDLTHQLNALINEGELSVTVGNDLAGRDPAYLVPKELRVDYSLDGVHRHTTAREGEILELPELGESADTWPPFSLSADTDGGVHLLAWSPGSFNLVRASGQSTTVRCSSVPQPLELVGPWELRFSPGWDAPEQITLDHLQSWSEHGDPGVKYYSGTARYIKDFDLPAERRVSGRELWLDLGVVKNFAEVSLNGENLGLLWKPPFRVNLTSAAKVGTNRLEIKVTNLWPNRLIGDEQLPPDCQWNGKRLKAWPDWLLQGKPSPTGRLTFTTWHHWTRSSPLLPSGLIGPVTLRSADVLPVD